MMHLQRILTAAAAVGLMAFTLPRPPAQSAVDVAMAECLTLADTPPDSHRSTLEALERCHALLPADFELMVDLGDAYDAAHQPERAEELYRRVLTIDASFTDVQLKLARLLQKRGAFDEARRHAKAGLELQPNRKALLNVLDQTARQRSGE